MVTSFSIRAATALLGTLAFVSAQAQDTPISIAHFEERFLADRLPNEPLQATAAQACVNGMADIYPCQGIDLLAFVPLAQFGNGQANDIWGWTDQQTGSEYALLGLTTGTAFVDISDPENPVYIGQLISQGGIDSVWRDIKVYADHAYIVSEAGGHGMQIFDLTQLRNVAAPPVNFTPSAHYSGFGNAHNLVINTASARAYAVGTNTCSGGLHSMDLSDPLAPAPSGCFSSDGYTHDAQCVVYAGPDNTLTGRELCFNANEDTLTIVDMTDPGAPVQLSRTGYFGSAYTHQGWLSEDHRFFFVGDEIDELNQGHNTRTRIFDISDPRTPQGPVIHDGRTSAIDHNMYTHQGLLYQANYRAGLAVLDLASITDPTLSEVGYFDIYTSNDNPSFNGAWSVYPYLSSGSILVSGIEQGLFVLRLASPAATQPSLGAAVPGSGGTLNQWALTGASAEVSVELYAGRRTGTSSPTIVACPDLELDIAGARRLAVAGSDTQGNATFSRFLPPNLSGRNQIYQAVDTGSCAVSNVVQQTLN